jgi:predicted ferric reductase
VLTSPAPVIVPSRGRTRGQRRDGDGAWDIGVVVVANVAVLVGLWLRHGGLAASHGPGGLLTGIGQLTGLLAAYAVLGQLVLMARLPPLERRLGFDRLAHLHRWNGFAVLWLVLAHATTISLGYAAADGIGIGRQLGDFLRHYPDVLMAIVATALLVGVAVSSARAARRRLPRETWYFVHLYAYLAVALAFAHQLAVGTDFSGDRLARAWWVALYVLAGGAIVWWRVARPLLFNARHGLRVGKVVNEAPGVVSLYIHGRDLASIDAEAGQFFLWRFLTRDGWWQAHPFSLSAAPNARWLRITIKDLGDFSHDVRRLAPAGTRVFAEGPYGAFTARRRTRRKVLLIAGGIGITPLRALVETMPGRPGDITLLYRAERERDLIFREELADLASSRGLVVHELVGTEIGDDRTDRLGMPAISYYAPDVADRDVYLCGPPGLVNAVHRRLRRLGVPRHQIHDERFAY